MRRISCRNALRERQLCGMPSSRNGHAARWNIRLDRKRGLGAALRRVYRRQAQVP